MDLVSEIMNRWKQNTSYNDPLSQASGEAASAYYNSGDQLREKYKHIFNPVEQASLVAKEREGLGKSFYGAQEMASSRQDELSTLAQAIAQGIQEEEARKQAERDYQLQLRAAELQEKLTRAQIAELERGTDEEEDFRKENAFLNIDKEINVEISRLMQGGTIPSKAINQVVNAYYNQLAVILPFGGYATPDDYKYALKVRLCAKADTGKARVKGESEDLFGSIGRGLTTDWRDVPSSKSGPPFTLSWLLDMITGKGDYKTDTWRD